MTQLLIIFPNTFSRWVLAESRRSKMRIKRELLTSILLVIFMVQQISAQKPANNDDEQRPAQTVQEIRNLADRVLRFQNRELRIKTTILLADVLWGKGKD